MMIYFACRHFQAMQLLITHCRPNFFFCSDLLLFLQLVTVIVLLAIPVVLFLYLYSFSRRVSRLALINIFAFVKHVSKLIEYLLLLEINYPATSTFLSCSVEALRVVRLHFHPAPVTQNKTYMSCN
jgi:hypothetical protein